MRTAVARAMVLLACVTASAEQLLFMSEEGYVWNYPTNDGSNTVVNIPDNYDFTQPDNYVDGYVYVRVNVTDKPSDKTLGLQLCFWKAGWNPETCSPQMKFATEGLHYARWKSPGEWWHLGDYDWTTPWYKARVFLKDGNNGSVLMATSSCGKYCFDGDLSAHIPVTYDIEVHFTTPGTVPQFPAHWNCPDGWGCTTASAAAFSRGPNRMHRTDGAIRVSRVGGTTTVSTGNAWRVGVTTLTGKQMWRSDQAEPVMVVPRVIPPGVYLIRADTPRGVRTARFVAER